MTTVLPFKILKLNKYSFHIIATIYINGKPARVVIDTGASKSVFDKKRIEKYVKKNSVVSNDFLSTGLGTKTMQSHGTLLKKIKAGKLEILNYETVLLDLSHVNLSYQEAGFKAIDGVLGCDILLDYKSVIDFEKKTVRFKFITPKKTH